MASLMNSVQQLKKNNTKSSQSFPNIEQEGTMFNPFCEASISLIPNPDKDITRKLQNNISYECKCKNSQHVSIPNLEII